MENMLSVNIIKPVMELMIYKLTLSSHSIHPTARLNCYETILTILRQKSQPKLNRAHTPWIPKRKSSLPKSLRKQSLFKYPVYFHSEIEAPRLNSPAVVPAFSVCKSLPIPPSCTSTFCIHPTNFFCFQLLLMCSHV
jgi:hypothetical protein